MSEIKNENSVFSLGFEAYRGVLILLSLGMIAVSIYLTGHYYEVQYPVSYFSNSVCDVSSYWNCDTATFSALSNVMGIPTSVFGIIVGILFLIGSLWAKPEIERTNLLLSLANAAGCMILFLYSVGFLGGLCPGCTIYYACSILAAIVMWKKGSKNPMPDFKVAGVWSLIAAAGMIYTYQYTQGKEKSIEKTAASIIGEFNKSADYSYVNFESPYRLASATEKFSDAPLRITLFSDFQCPVCKAMAEKILPKLINHYKGKLNFQYYFYPMDSACNHNISQPMHPMACESSYVAACLPDQFTRIHDELYDKQNELSFQLMQKLANSNGVSSCYNDIKTKEIIEKMILEADRVEVQATPTMIINGKKLEGLMPLKYLILLCEEAMKTKDQGSY